jgi:hypothetical protein
MMRPAAALLFAACASESRSANEADDTARFGDSTDVATWRGIDAFTLMKHDGRWRIVSLAYTDAP